MNIWISSPLFWPAWILANIAGWIIYALIPKLPLGPLWGSLSVALLIGVFQWLVLKKYLGMDWRWAFASIAVYGAFFLVLFYKCSSPQLMWWVVVVSALAGILQYLILKEYLERAIFWIFAHTIACYLAIEFVDFINYVFFKVTSAISVWALVGLFYGLFTGGVLSMLITRQEKQKKIWLEEKIQN